MQLYHEYDVYNSKPKQRPSEHVMRRSFFIFLFPLLLSLISIDAICALLNAFNIVSLPGMKRDRTSGGGVRVKYSLLKRKTQRVQAKITKEDRNNLKHKKTEGTYHPNDVRSFKIYALPAGGGYVTVEKPGCESRVVLT